MDRLEKQVMSTRPYSFRAGGYPLIRNPAPTLRGLSVKRGDQSTRLFGQSSTRVLVNLVSPTQPTQRSTFSRASSLMNMQFDDAKEFLHAKQRTADIDDTLLHFRKLHRTLRDEYQDSLVPMTVFVDSVMPVWKRMWDILPQKPVCDRLVAAYMDISEGICRILHFPSFSEQYNRFWEDKLQSDYFSLQSDYYCFLPQLLAVLAIVSRFTTKSQGFSHERVEGVHTPTAFALVRTWLDSLKGKQLTDVAVLQVELLLIVCRRALMFRPQELWVQLGNIVRMAMTMGLHRDPSEFGTRLSPFMGEMRRRLWFAVFELDVQHSFDSDMPCAIRDGDYSCQPPRNLHDEDIYPDMKELPPDKPVEEQTKMQAQVLGIFSLPVRSRISHLLCRIDTLRDYQEVLELGSRLEDILEDISQITPRLGITDHSRMDRVWRERVSSDSIVRRALLSLYRPFALSAHGCPPLIAKSFLRSCMTVLGYSEELDPMVPHHHQVMGILHQVSRNDILSAAFGVCYFIRSSAQPQANGIPYDGHRGPRQSTESPSRSPPLPTGGHLLWSPERLIQAVERTHGYFVQNIVRNTGTKDIVALTVVLEMVRTRDPKTEIIARALRATLEGSLNAANSSREKLALVKPIAVNVNAPGFAPDHYMGGQPGAFGFGTPGVGHINPLSAVEGWTIWGGWD